MNGTVRAAASPRAGGKNTSETPTWEEQESGHGVPFLQLAELTSERSWRRRGSAFGGSESMDPAFMRLDRRPAMRRRKFSLLTLDLLESRAVGDSVF
jgi:hypothetical protein